MFYAGIQWIRYEPTSSQWRPISIPAWFPKHITNKFAVSVDTMKSVFESSRPVTTFGPGNADEIAIAAAEAAGDISDVIDTEVDNERLRSQLASWIATCGNGFIVDSYDAEGGGKKFVRSYACLKCAKVHQPDEITQAGACPACGGTALMPATDKDGGQVGEHYPIGRMRSECGSPLEFSFDMQAGQIEDSEFLIRAKTYSTDTVRSMFPDHAEKIMPSAEQGEHGTFYQRAIAYVNNNAGGGGHLVVGVGASQSMERTTLFHLWKKPCKDLPYGGQALVCNDMELWKGEMSTKEEDGTPFYPVTHFKFKDQPGRIFGKTPADDLVSKQIQRNKIESWLQLGMERVANPVWLLPTGIGIEKLTGEPGEKVWYNGLLNGLRPERLPGMEMPGSAFRWLEQIDHDFEDISASYDVLKGEAPKGVPTLGATNTLRDMGMARFGDGLNSWGRGWTLVRRKRLQIWKDFASDERTQMVLGDDSRWQAKKFLNSSIGGPITVRLEEGSQVPRSKSYQQQLVGQAVQAQMVDMNDPLTRLEVMSILDMGDLVKGLDIDVKDSIKEREEFQMSGQTRFRMLIDNHAVHLAQHIKDAKSDDFRNWPPQAQQLWYQHIQMHKNAIKQLQAEAQQAQPQPKMVQANIATDALQKKKAIEIDAQQKKQAMNLEHDGLKKQMDLGATHRKGQMAEAQMIAEIVAEKIKSQMDFQQQQRDAAARTALPTSPQ